MLTEMHGKAAGTAWLSLGRNQFGNVNGSGVMADLRLDSSELRPMVEAVVAEVLRELEQHRQVHNGRLAYSESEAAGLLGLHSWQLRDLRLDGKIDFARIVGGRIRYTLDDLSAYLRRGRQEGKG